MPQINRIRIINFSYNNHNRNIIDETFDFFQGEHALLSLKNGGGKSVLVQLLLQPILPKTKLMSRRVEDFFKGKKTPSYILVEWKLEDQGGYLLTGIGLANRDTQVREQDETSNSIKFFTFTSHYREANLFDLENIPLLKQSAEKIYIEDFKEAKRLLTTKAKDTHYSVAVFSDEDGLDYRKHLESFNIFQDEWKSIVLKINESEGGVIEIFEKCKTSQQLMNDWILKSIEKVINQEENDQKKLEQMLENLVEDMIHNEQFIYEKELYQEFLRKTEEFFTKLNELTESLDKESKLESNIARMYYFLKHEIQQMKDVIERNNDVIASSQMELKRIDLEERSKAYYDELNNVEKLSVIVSEEADQLKQKQEELKVNKHEVRVQQAARELGHIKRINLRIASIREEMKVIRSSGDHDEEIKNLEYSLKLGYEKLVEELRVKELEIKNSLEEVLSLFSKSDQRITEIDTEIGDLKGKKGSVDTKIDQFEDTEQRICLELELTYERNLLGEIEQVYQEQYFKGLEEKVNQFDAEKRHLDVLVEENKQLVAEAKDTVIEKRRIETEYTVKATKLAGEITDYNQLKAAIKSIFGRYELDFNNRFNHQQTQLFIENRIIELNRTERELDLERHMLRETMTSLKNGTLHVSKEFRQWLINEDIDFETGENYLRKQSPSIRNDLIKQNPTLPFAFLLYEEDLEKLKSMDIGCKVHQMVPILSYNNLNQAYSVQGRMVYMADKLQFLCLYDHRMIDADNLEGYLSELERELEKVKDQLSHYREQLETAREDLQLVRQFIFEQDYLYNLERDQAMLGVELENVQSEISELEEKQVKLSDEIANCKTRINEISNLLEKEDLRKNKAVEFFKNNEQYVENRQLAKEYFDAIQSLDKEKKIILEQKDSLLGQRDELVTEKARLIEHIKDSEGRLEKYLSAVSAVQLDEDVKIMEERLKVLKQKLTSTLERLEQELEDKKTELREKKAELYSLQLEESQYCDVVFDSAKLLELQNKGFELEKEEESINDSYRKANVKLGVAKGKLESAESEVIKLAEAPLEPTLIKLNFSARRKAEKDREIVANNQINELRKLSRGYENLSNKIEGKIDVTKFAVNATYEIKVDVVQDYNAQIKELALLLRENTQHRNTIHSKYSQLKATYQSKNKHLENILAGWDPLMEGAQSDNNKYYYLGERMLLSNESLNKLIKACEDRLSNVEKNKKDMIQHSYLHAKQVFDEIQKISENSSIKLDGKNRPVPMLKIHMEPLNTEEDNSTKMESYIENCVTIIKGDMKEEKKIEEIRKKISRYMSTRELLHVLSDLGKMKISAYKIDINARNSTYKSWEQVMKENSGGERFVSFFAVIVALMSYTRTSMKFEDDYQRNQDTKVLIMDNPFGPISSEHLLKPLFKIAKKYNTQLICLTDLKQNSILNCFNLIYMLKIRQNVFGTTEYLQLEQQIKEDAKIEQDEKLEKAVFKVEEVEQMSLL
jgi:energy-coupling factor transporter ATP-binding protein EcfA2